MSTTPSETVGYFFVRFDDTNIENPFGFCNVLTKHNRNVKRLKLSNRFYIIGTSTIKNV